jgi:hypothetical protein
VYTIFPQKPGISPLLPYNKNNIAIPDENSYNMLDDVKGKSYYCFLYSKESLDLKELLKQVKIEKGTFLQKVQKSLGDKIIKKDIKYSCGDEIRFRASTIDKKLIAVIVEFEHK